METATKSSRRWWSLAALALSVLVIGLDGTVLNVALPTLAVDLHAGTADLQWIVDAYLVVLAALMLPMGLLGDRIGRKRLILTGLLFFLAASVAAAFAPGTGTLIAARAAMGIGAAIIMPVSMAILPSIFGPEERGRAIAIWTAGTALGLPLGPIVGGYLLEHYWWGSVFLINVPVIAIALVAGWILLPESRDPASRPLDPIGTLLAVGGLGALVFGIIQAPADGWTSPTVFAPVIGGAAALAAFTVTQLRSRQPMVDLRLFRNRTFLWGTIGAIFVQLTMIGVLFALPQYLQIVQGNGTLGTGVRLIPLIAGIMVGGLSAERFVVRLGYRVVVTAGMLVTALGFALGAFTSIDDRYAHTAAWLSVLGLGMGLALPTIMDAVLATVPEDRAGAGSGLLQALRQVGGALGVALLGSLLSWSYSGSLDVSGLPPAAGKAARDSIAGAAAVAAGLHDPGLLAAASTAFVHAMDVMLVVCAVGAVAGGVLVAIFLPARAVRETADRQNEEHEFSRIA